jgi:hypothetical protein
MRRVLVIAALLTTVFSALGRTVGAESHIGDKQKTARLLKSQSGTLNRVLEADLAASNIIGPTNSTHLDMPHPVFED